MPNHLILVINNLIIVYSILAKKNMIKSMKTEISEVEIKRSVKWKSVACGSDFTVMVRKD